MDFTLSEEQTALQEMARKFAASELGETAHEVEEPGMPELLASTSLRWVWQALNRPRLGTTTVRLCSETLRKPPEVDSNRVKIGSAFSRTTVSVDSPRC